MKKIVSIIAMTTIFAISGCEQFSTSYDRVDESEFRMLKYIWEPADAAPGDTITLTAVFAGKRVDLDDYLKWEVSFKVIRDFYGNTTVVDSALLENHGCLLSSKTTVGDARWPNTQSVEFKIRVPDDIVRNSPSVPEEWAEALPVQMRNALPAEFAALTKTQIVDMIEAYANSLNAGGGGNAGALPQIPESAVIPVLQYFTVPMRVSTKMQEPGRLPHTITSTQYIRYNSRFKKFKNTINIPVNNIPTVDRVVVYKVRGDVGNIDNKNGLALDSIALDNTGNSVITVEDGYSYFLDAISHPIDTTVTMDGNKITEKHRVYRQFQLDAKETAGIHHSKFLDVNNFNGKISFPTDRRITKFIFWLTVYDEAQNERLRPNGETLYEVSGRLIYK